MSDQQLQDSINDYWTERAPSYDAYQQRPERRDLDVEAWGRVWSAALPPAPADVLDVVPGGADAQDRPRDPAPAPVGDGHRSGRLSLTQPVDQLDQASAEVSTAEITSTRDAASRSCGCRSSPSTSSATPPASRSTPTIAR